MRLKENADSWRASGIQKRDFKHDHSEPAVRFHARKPTNKWCRGRVGVKHDVAWRQKVDFFGNAYKTGTCARCRKQMFGRPLRAMPAKPQHRAPAPGSAAMSSPQATAPN